MNPKSSVGTKGAPRESWGRLARNMLIVLAVIGGFTYAAFPIAALFGWLAHPEGRVAVFLAGSIVGEWAALGVMLWIGRGQSMTLRDLGWGRPTSWGALGLGVLVAAIYCAMTSANPQVGLRLIEWSPLKLLALVAALTAGIVEETVFRGYVVTVLGRMNYPAATQVLVSGLVFALAHVYGFASAFAYVISLGLTFMLGIALGIVYLAGKESLTPVILSHVLIDAVIEPWLLLGLFTAPAGKP